MAECDHTIGQVCVDIESYPLMSMSELAELREMLTQPENVGNMLKDKWIPRPWDAFTYCPRCGVKIEGVPPSQ